jgi:hypothetical protein
MEFQFKNRCWAKTAHGRLVFRLADPTQKQAASCRMWSKERGSMVRPAAAHLGSDHDAVLTARTTKMRRNHWARYH